MSYNNNNNNNDNNNNKERKKYTNETNKQTNKQEKKNEPFILTTYYIQKILFTQYTVSIEEKDNKSGRGRTEYVLLPKSEQQKKWWIKPLNFLFSWGQSKSLILQRNV